MRLKQLVYEDFVNYKKPSMFLGTCICDWKCCKENSSDTAMCQNSPLASTPIVEIDDKILVSRYVGNPITSAVVIGGLEPMLQFEEILSFVKEFRVYSNDDIVIYTGYYPNEIQDKLQELRNFKNIIVKFGRFVPNKEKKYDDVLGVYLASSNQFAKAIS